MERKRRILVAPLDWGLGHATRCIPVINALLKRNAEVIIASSGSAATLLKKEFPALNHYTLPAYNPRYPVNGNMVWGMAWQLPGFIKTIYAEHARINELVEAEKIDVLISDNRYGCYSPRAKSIFIGHQLHILMPQSHKWMEPTVNRFNHRQIKNFDECWIPAPDNSLLGDLLPENLPKHCRFIGYLSRCKKQTAENKYAVLAIASGPDPQRTALVNMLRLQMKASGLMSLLVRGEVEDEEKTEEIDNYFEVNYLTTDRLNTAIAESDIVIARPGYSTVMDLGKLGKKAIFIPTPGQTEQTYLAAQLMSKGIAFYMEQSAFNFKTALKESDKFGGFTNFGYDDALLDQAIQSVL